MSEQKILRYDDVPLNKKTVELLVDSKGMGWSLDKESSFRYSECTHRKCESCDNHTPKMYTYCESCREKIYQERWESAEKGRYPEHGMVYSEALEKYFTSPDEIEEESDISEISIADMRLYICDREYAPCVDLEDIYEGVTPEDFYIDDMITPEIKEACDKLNQLIKDHPVNCFTPSKVALDLNE